MTSRDLNASVGTVTRDAARHVGIDGIPQTNWTNPQYANDGSNSTTAGVAAGNDGSWYDYIKSDLGAAYRVTAFNLSAPDAISNGLTDFQYSTDGTSWHSISGTWSGVVQTTPGGTLTFDAPIDARYWAMEAHATGSHSGITATRWEILGDDIPPGVYMDWLNDGFGAGIDDVTTYVASWVINRGGSPEITGGAQPGSATIVLKNTGDRFNPYYAAGPLYGKLIDGVPVWIGVNNDGTLTGTNPVGLFAGRITDITLLPAGGATTSPMVEIQCEDALSWYRRLRARFDYATGRSHNAIRTAALVAAGETRYTLDAEIETTPLSHADGDLLSVLDAINGINGTRHWCDPADSAASWYTYRTRNRQWRLDATVDATLSASSNHVTGTDGWRRSADGVINSQKATVEPIAFTPATFTVWEADVLPIGVTTTAPYSRLVEFDDVVSGSSVNIAYTGSAVTTTYTPFASAGKIVLSSAGTSSVTQLAVNGQLARRLPQESYEENDTTSQSGSRGVRAGGEISGEYLGVLASARGIAQHVVWRYGNPQLRPTLTVENWFPTMFTLDLYDTISFTSTQLGMTAVIFEIIGLTHTADVAATTVQHHTVTYVLQESRSQTDPGWFVLNSSLLNGVKILGY